MLKLLIAAVSLLSSAAMAGNQEVCESYQFTPGTPEFSNCLMQLDIAQHQQAQQEMAQRRAAMMQMYKPIVPYQMTPYQMPVNPQTNCRWIGNVWNCQ